MSKSSFLSVALIMAGMWLLAGSDCFAGEKWQDIKGITVDANNHNAALIRRDRNRRQRDLNEVNSIPRYLYDTTPRRNR